MVRSYDFGAVLYRMRKKCEHTQLTSVSVQHL